MEWLSQNWIWVILIVGVVLLFSRIRHGSLMGGCGMHGMAHEGPAGEVKGQGTETARPASKDEKSGQAAERGSSSHHRGRGGCC